MGARRRAVFVALAALAAGGGASLGALAFKGLRRSDNDDEHARHHLDHLDHLDDHCITAPLTPYDAAAGLPLDAARAVPADARCPVCGMFPARHPAWAAQVIFADGDAQFFDSPASLARYLLRVERYAPGRRREDIVASYVRAAQGDQGRQGGQDGAWLKAEGAHYVHAPSLLGPMRTPNYLPFADAPRAGARAAATPGAVVLRLGDLLLREGPAP